MKSNIEIDPNRLQIFHELRKRRIYVGELIYDHNKDIYKLIYDQNYASSRNAIAIGPELNLFQIEHISSKGKLFASLLDRIPEKSNPAYIDYCRSEGISPDEKNKIILLGSIGKRGPSSFVFEPVYKTDFTTSDIIKLRKKLGISQNDLSIAFGIKKVTLQRIESGSSKENNTLKLLQIYFTYPNVAIWQLKQTGARVHSSALIRLLDYFHNKK